MPESPNDVMVVRSQIDLTYKQLWELHEMLLAMKDSGVVVLPKGCEIVVVYDRCFNGIEVEASEDE